MGQLPHQWQVRRGCDFLSYPSCVWRLLSVFFTALLCVQACGVHCVCVCVCVCGFVCVVFVPACGYRYAHTKLSVCAYACNLSFVHSICSTLMDKLCCVLSLLHMSPSCLLAPSLHPTFPFPRIHPSCSCMCVYVCMCHMCVYVCTCVSVCVHVCSCVCVYTCMCRQASIYLM